MPNDTRKQQKPGSGAAPCSAPEDDIIARCGSCKRIVFWAANLPEVMDAKAYKTLGKLIADGCTIEHVTTDKARADKWGCKCSPNAEVRHRENEKDTNED